MAYQAPPAAAAPAAAPAPATAPAPAPRPTGLGTQGVAASGGKKARQKRKSAPMREGPVWKSVRVTKEHDTTPQVQCLSCEKLLRRGVGEHIMGSRPTSEYFLGAEAVCQRQSALSCVCVCVYQSFNRSAG